MCRNESVCVLVCKLSRSIHPNYKELLAQSKGNSFLGAGTWIFLWDVNCQDSFANSASDFTEPLAPVAALCLWWALKDGWKAGSLYPRSKYSAAFVDFNRGDNCECQMAAYNVLTEKPQGCSLGIPESITWTESLEQSLKIRISLMWNVCCGRWSAAIWFAGSREVVVNIF